ncbi:hypothetical protein Zmor_012178 [Zophobas morio]|uniref:CCAAT-binding factor domain-containing protein n=1 Tax=Zophobas morio TaxID=2755281 RepID=A0AA38HH45_9CUCU|nr:hypothetical protein Zmor_012178 [Zophobas morio]
MSKVNKSHKINLLQKELLTARKNANSLLELLTYCELLEQEADIVSLSAHRKVFSHFWLSFLRQLLPLRVYKRVLLMLEKSIIPFLNKPRLLIDFLTESYDKGGVYSLLSLSGLYVLITKYDLDYNDFYKKLYSLLDHQLFFMKHRHRFLALMDQCLSSPLLSASLVAAFIKRLCRLALRAPLSGVAVILPLIYNLLRRHPNTLPMIHRYKSAGEDCYDYQEVDPERSLAIESSLWELDALMNHYVPSLSKFAASFKEPFGVADYKIGEFLNHDYTKIIEEELKKKVKSVPLEFSTPSGLLTPAMPMWTLD